MAYLKTLFSSTLIHIPPDIRNLFYLSVAEHLAAVLMVRFSSAGRGKATGRGVGQSMARGDGRDKAW